MQGRSNQLMLNWQNEFSLKMYVFAMEHVAGDILSPHFGSFANKSCCPLKKVVRVSWDFMLSTTSTMTVTDDL